MESDRGRCVKKAILYSLGLILLVCSHAHARDLSLDTIMSQIGDEMRTLYPLIYAQRELSIAEIDELLTRVEHMQSLFVEAGPHIGKRAATYAVSYDFINTYYFINI